MKTTPILQDLFLLGGGHAHALVINQWRMKPMPGVRLTLISPDTYTPYSGMLPGLLAGHYGFDDSHIDLDHLCSAANVRFIQAAATGLDLINKTVVFAHRPALAFDLISINTGASPNLEVPGSAQFSLPVKPISALYPRWQSLLETLKNREGVRLAVVGAGAAAIEIGAALRHCAPRAKLAVFFPEHLPLEGYRASFRQGVANRLNELHIELMSQHTIAAVKQGCLIDSKGNEHLADAIFWCVDARAPTWLADTGLALDEKGFINVSNTLQSTSHGFVFAAGDVAALVTQPRPKAGVFAVREAPVLFHNLLAQLTNQPLRVYKAQNSFLSILSFADGNAMATRAGGYMPTLSGAWVWRWKDRIDRQFMASFRHQLPMPNPEHTAPTQSPKITKALWGELAPTQAELAMRCGGCGAKVGANILTGVISKLHTVKQPEVLIGLDQPDDAAALHFPANTTLIQSVDQFRAIIADPFLQGQIAALHALSDLHAMHAQPHSAQALVSLPFARDSITNRDLTQLMTGALTVLNREHCQLIGGHTSEGLETSVGFAVNGIAKAPLLTKTGLKVGDRLILTQPLGTGAIFAAQAQLFSQGNWVQHALKFMLQSNAQAAHILFQQGATACTDITGFGLAGHLLEMLRTAQLAARLQLHKIPAIDGALACIAAGKVSSLQRNNLMEKAGIADIEQWLADPRVQLLFDPQTSGGLLVGLAAEKTAAALTALQDAGYSAHEIGEVSTMQTHLITLTESE